MSVLEEDSSDATAGVVLGGADGRGHRLGRLEERLKDGKKLDDVIETELGVHVLDEDTSSKGGVGSDLSLLVRKTEVNEFEEGLDVGSNRTLETGDDFSERANSHGSVRARPLVGLATLTERMKAKEMVSTCVGLTMTVLSTQVGLGKAATHVVLPDKRKELSEGSGKVGTKDAGKGTDDVRGVGDESRLVLGGVLLLGNLIIGIRIKLAERLLLEDLLGVGTNSLEVLTDWTRWRAREGVVTRHDGERVSKRLHRVEPEDKCSLTAFNKGRSTLVHSLSELVAAHDNDGSERRDRAIAARLVPNSGHHEETRR